MRLLLMLTLLLASKRASAEDDLFITFDTQTYCREELNVCSDLNLPEAENLHSVLTSTSGPMRRQHVIQFEKSQLFKLPMKIFEVFPNLKELAAQNCSLRKLDAEDFRGASQLKVLQLSDNEVDAIPDFTFAGAESLGYLVMNGNRVRELTRDTFNGLAALRFLSMEDNELESLPVDCFKALVALEILTLTGNRIENLPDGIFDHSPNLYAVDLRENRLKTVGEMAFLKLPALTILDVSHNPQLEGLTLQLQDVITLYAANCALKSLVLSGNVSNVYAANNRIQELYFENAQTLQNADFRNNSLRDLQTFAVGRLIIEILDLSQNPLAVIQPGVLNGMENLRTLNLSQTELSNLPDGVPSHLSTLDISRNKISHLDLTRLDSLRNLDNFYIDHNDWDCFKLRTVLDVLILPEGMHFYPDEANPDFLGEYINGIACLYKIDNEPNSAQLRAEPTSDCGTDIEALRSELKAVVLFYEQKFDKVFQQMAEMQRRLEWFDGVNETLWGRVTLST